MVLDDTLKNYFSSAAGASADHTTALRAPPQRGATMNTQRSLRACSAGVGHRVGTKTSCEIRSGDNFRENEEGRAGDDGSDDLAVPQPRSVRTIVPMHSAMYFLIISIIKSSRFVSLNYKIIIGCRCFFLNLQMIRKRF